MIVKVPMMGCDILNESLGYVLGDGKVAGLLFMLVESQDFWGFEMAEGSVK